MDILHKSRFDPDVVEALTISARVWTTESGRRVAHLLGRRANERAFLTGG